MRAVIHTGSFLSRAGVVWRVDIWKEGYTSTEAAAITPGELDFPADEPLVIEWDDKSKEEVVCGSSCTLRIISPGDRTYADLYATSVASIGIDVYRDGELHWTGTLDPFQYEEPYERAWGYDVMLTFTDFGVLDRLRYNLKGLQKMSDVLTDALTRAGLSAAQVDYESYVSSRHVPIDNSTPSAWDPSTTIEDEAIYFDDGSGALRPRIDGNLPAPIADSDRTTTASATLYTLGVVSGNFYDDDDEGSTLMEVIEAMLQPMAMRIVQRGGVIWVYDLNALALAAQSGESATYETEVKTFRMPDTAGTAGTSGSDTDSGITWTWGRRWDGVQSLTTPATTASLSSASGHVAIKIPATDLPGRLSEVGLDDDAGDAFRTAAWADDNMKVISLVEPRLAKYFLGKDGILSIKLADIPTDAAYLLVTSRTSGDNSCLNKRILRWEVTVEEDETFHTVPVHWTSDTQTMSADKTVSSIKVTFSPNGGGALMTNEDAKYGLSASPTDFDFNGNGNRYTYHSDYGHRADPTDTSFTIHYGKGEGMASVVSDALSYYKVVAQFGGQDSEGILAWLTKGHQTWNASLPKLDESTTGILFRTRRVYVPPVDSAGAGIAYMLRLTQEMLLDVRYNPFEEAVGDNEGGRYDDWKTQANYVYVAADLRLWDSETGGNVLYYYSNRAVASHGETKSYDDGSEDETMCSLGNKMGAWVKGAEPQNRSEARCWLSWYDQSAYDTRADSSGILGWKGNRHNIGIARGDLMRDLREVPDGEYIPYPPCGGWLEVSVWGGIFLYDNINHNSYSTRRVTDNLGRPDDTTTTGVLYGIPYNLLDTRLNTVGVRWCLFRHPKLEIVENGVKREVPDPDDDELTAWTEASTGEELSIDTTCGVLTDPAPNARGHLYDISGASAAPLRRIERSGRRARPEELLCGTLYSQFAERHTILSGEASITPGGLHVFTERCQSGKFFILSGEAQNCIEDTTEAAYVELSADSWDSDCFDKMAQHEKVFYTGKRRQQTELEE